MKLPVKILLVNMGVAIFAALSFAATDNFRNFLGWFGLACLIIALLDLLIAIVCLAIKNVESAKGFFLSSGVLLLMGFLSCSTSLGSAHY